VVAKNAFSIILDTSFPLTSHAVTAAKSVFHSDFLNTCNIKVNTYAHPTYMSLNHNFNFSVFKDKENYLNGGFFQFSFVSYSNLKKH
jgi:hypothetical protein